MARDTLRGSPADIVGALLAGATDATLTCPRSALFRGLVTDLVEGDDRAAPSGLRVLVTPAVADDVRDDFFAASHVADLAADGLEVRVAAAGALDDAVFVTDGRAVVLVGDAPETVGVDTTDQDVRGALATGFEDRWDDASPFDPGAPPYSALRESMAEGLDEAVGASFDAVATGDFRTRSLDGPLDVVDVLLLVTAMHGEQFYRVSRWGEREEVASVTKFSQSKRRLEAAGLVETERVDTGSVGRPRQRLVLAEPVADGDVHDVVAAAQSVLVD